MFDEIKKRLENLKQMVKHSDSDLSGEIKSEIKNLYILFSNAQKSLSRFQEELRQIVQSAKKRRDSTAEVEKFYSFIKARSSAELDIATFLDRAWNLIAVEEYDEAIKVIQQALAIDEHNIRALGLMGLAMMHREKYDQAMMYLQQVIIEDPDNPFALNNLGYICYKKGIWGEAIEHLTRAAKQQKDRMASLYANYYLGLVYFERSMLNDAASFFTKALQLGPNLQEAYFYLGLTETKRYEFKKAITFFKQCLDLDPESKYGRMAEQEMNIVKLLVDPKQISQSNYPKNQNHEN